VYELPFVTARSSHPSPFRSPRATPVGLSPVMKSVFCLKVPSPCIRPVIPGS
jgi:hypothetical protein